MFRLSAKTSNFSRDRWRRNRKRSSPCLGRLPSPPETGIVRDSVTVEPVGARPTRMFIGFRKSGSATSRSARRQMKRFQLLIRRQRIGRPHAALNGSSFCWANDGTASNALTSDAIANEKRREVMVGRSECKFPPTSRYRSLLALHDAP